MATVTCWIDRAAARARSLDDRILGPTGGRSIGSTLLALSASSAAARRRSVLRHIAFAGCFTLSAMVMMVEYAFLGLMTVLLHPFRGP